MISRARYEIDLSRLRVPSLLFLASGATLAHLPSTWGLPCPLRGLTGIPCPFCGSTTAVREGMSGQFRSAVSTAPLALALVPIAIMLLLGLSRRKLLINPVLLASIIAAEWGLELHRFGLL
jgi:hypothetical protein